jgi:hypothetical protein
MAKLEFFGAMSLVAFTVINRVIATKEAILDSMDSFNEGWSPVTIPVPVSL